MIPAGVLGASSLVPAAAAGAGVSFVDEAFSNAGGTSWTFSGLSLGSADATRLIVVSAHTRGGSVIDSITVAGVSATEVVARYTTDVAVLWVAAVPTGTTGDVVVTSSGSFSRMAVAVHRMVGMSATADSTDNSSSGTLSVTVATGGVIVAAATRYAGGGELAHAWTGVDDASDQISDGIINSASGIAGPAVSGGSVGIVSDWGGSSGGSGIVCAASFPPL